MQATVLSPWITRLVLLALSWLLSACGLVEKQKNAARLERAQALYQQHCRDAGEKIYKTVDNVEGIFLIKVRPEGLNWGDQYRLDDPYGSDFDGDAYIEYFLRLTPPPASERDRNFVLQPRAGYEYVDAVDPKDGQHYRYTGRLEEPWQTNKRYLKGSFQFVLDKARTTGATARYGVTYEDISTREDRDYWIAGSRLQVIDMQTGEVLAERIGYMVDAGQGSSAGGRSPWLHAANNSCPAFLGQHASSNQLGQTRRFVTKVLIPKP